MPTLVLDAYSRAYPAISNRIRASVLTEVSGSVVASIIDSAVGHPARIWHFPGLPRNNYQFSLDEINGGGFVVNNLAMFSVVPGVVEGTLNRADEQISVGNTPGFNTGATAATFDGREVSPGQIVPNYIGWDIVPSELTGRGILVRGFDYSWDKVTGIFQMLVTGDQLQAGTWYNIHFNPISNPQGNSYPTINDFQTELITADTTLDLTYIGKKIIVEPAGDYVQIILPDVNTVPPGRKTMFEVGGTGIRCMKLLPLGSDVINWLRGNVYANSNESFSLYAFDRGGVMEWRICDAFGNFSTCGQMAGEDLFGADVINKRILDGTTGSIYQFARLYNEVVLNLPLTQVCNYDDWATGNNKYLYSLANSADPGNALLFHFPDRRGITERNNIDGKAGDYNDWEFPTHEHETASGTLPSTLFGRGIINRTIGKYSGSAVGNTDLTGTPVQSNGIASPHLGAKVLVENYLINKHVIV